LGQNIIGEEFLISWADGRLEHRTGPTRTKDFGDLVRPRF